MSVLLEGTEQLEQELTPDPVMAPATGSILLHLGLVAGIVLYGIVGGFFHHNFWGGPGMGGAVQVNLVSNALPLPSNQPVNQNVLATEKPSEAPAPPTPKAKQAEDLTAIPISGKQKKAEKETTPRTPPRKEEPVPTNRANYGEQAGSSMPRTSQQAELYHWPNQRQQWRFWQSLRMGMSKRSTVKIIGQLGTSHLWTREPRGVPARPALISRFPATGRVG